VLIGDLKHSELGIAIRPSVFLTWKLPIVRMQTLPSE